MKLLPRAVAQRGITDPVNDMALSVSRSRQRCAALQSTFSPDPDALSAADLAFRREQHAQLLAAAQPELHTLAAMVSSAKSVVLLADATGVILEEAGSTEFLRKAERVALRPGVSWAEAMRGTNAIGTALMDAVPIRVHGSEHFLACNSGLSCHAAPIRSPTGDLLGVLDISSEATAQHVYALGLAQLCARQISNRLLDNAGSRLDRLVFQRQPSLLDSAERAILLIEDEHIVGANDAALHLLGGDWGLLGAPVRDWIDDWKHLGESPQRLVTRQGSALSGALRHGTAPSPSRTNPDSPCVSAPSRRRRADKKDSSPAGLPRLGPHAEHLLHDAINAVNADMAVLLGETGAGKEIFARHVHGRSSWRTGPFLAVNCGALPESLIESELFGYAPGAFTGARREGSPGLLRQAEGGILFLDEIGDMPLGLQTRLLRALQEREVQPLGSNKRIPVRFGVISATNRTLDAMMAAGQFRSDLYYRLQDYKAMLPPLRERPDLRHFLDLEFQRLGSAARDMTLTESALDALACYQWPGNYRQMQSVLRSLVALKPAGSLIQPEDLPTEIGEHCRVHGHVACRTPVAPAVGAATLRDMNDQAVRRVIQEYDHNLSRAAGILGVHRSTLYRYMARFKTAAPNSHTPR
ncbi:MAG TPA: sigma-54-dependent Fis family transcriptional regulator [Burkholderiaceae bacterium]|nr:sigma-54-dependent Fis family transcriptional regulator [Burkholderiaceae bacterium]